MPELVRGGTGTIGVRIPNHSVTRSIIRMVGFPLLGPSANFHGKETPYVIEQLDKKLIEKVDYVVGGTCTIKKPSTVIDCSYTPWNILREGAIHINIV